MKEYGCLLVSWDFSGKDDVPVVLVGEKTTGEAAKIVNAFQGQKARDIIKTLTTVVKEEG